MLTKKIVASHKENDYQFKQINSKPLPASIEARIVMALEKITCPTCKRVLQYIAAHSDNWMHHIVRECSCFNVKQSEGLAEQLKSRTATL